MYRSASTAGRRPGLFVVSVLVAILCGGAARPGYAQALVPAGERTAAVEAAAAEPADRDDPVFHLVMGSVVTAASADLAISMYEIGRGAARERAFGAAWQDSPVAFALTKGATVAVFTYGLQRLHKTRPKTAIVLGIVQTAVEGYLVARTARIGAAAR